MPMQPSMLTQIIIQVHTTMEVLPAPVVVPAVPVLHTAAVEQIKISKTSLMR